MGAKLSQFTQVIHHGSHAQQRKGYLPQIPPIQAHCAVLGQAVRCRHRQGDLQHGQEGLHPVADWRRPQGFPRHPSGQDDPATRSCASSARGASPLPSLRTSTASSRRPSPCASTLRRTARTRTLSSVSFSSSPASTASRVTTAWPRCCRPTSSTSLPTPPPWLCKQLALRL